MTESNPHEQLVSEVAGFIHMHRKDIAAGMAPYGVLVHPEDLPLGYQPGMKLQQADLLWEPEQVAGRATPATEQDGENEPA